MPKLADRKPHPSSSPESLELRRQCIAARRIDEKELENFRAYIAFNLHQILDSVNAIHSEQPIAANRILLDDAEKRTTILRTQLKTMRRHANAIANRDAREENGVLIP